MRGCATEKQSPLYVSSFIAKYMPPLQRLVKFNMYIKNGVNISL